MSFRKPAALPQPVDLSSLSPEEAEKRILLGVRRFAADEARWASADRNTPFLGHAIGMGIESSNLADIAMSMERQFLTAQGPLRIRDGEDAAAATPGLAVKMLMDLGHMPRSEAYLEGVASFACLNLLADGHRLDASLRKAADRLDGWGDAPGREDALANLRALSERAQAYRALAADPAAFASDRRRLLDRERAATSALAQEMALLDRKIEGALEVRDPDRAAALRSQRAEVATRMRMTEERLRLAEEEALDARRRKAVEEAKVREILALLEGSLRRAGRL